MLNILVVDDDRLATKAIAEIIIREKGTFDIQEVMTAGDAAEARAVMEDNNIGVLICDIEMPNESGLSLIKSIGEQNPDTVCILMTCYAEFEYAHQALKLGCNDYLLKPVMPDVLLLALQHAIDTLAQRQATRLMDKRAALWRQNSVLLVNQFWNNVVYGSETPDTARLNTLEGVREEDASDAGFILVYVNIQFWDSNPSASGDLSLSNQADKPIRDLASALILEEESVPVLLRESDHAFMLVLHRRSYSAFNPDMIIEKCENFIYACNAQYGCNLCCSMSDPVAAAEVRDHVEKMRHFGMNNVINTNRVFSEEEFFEHDGGARFFSAEKLTMFLKDGLEGEALKFIRLYLDSLAAQEQINADFLWKFQQNILQIISNVMSENGALLSGIPLSKQALQISSRPACHVEELMQWIEEILPCVVRTTEVPNRSADAVKIAQKYIEQNIGQPITCRQIAKQVYMHPDYFSRIFKRETHKALSTYLFEKRMERAKEYLEYTSLPVGTIAMNVGFSSFAYFSTAFKRYADTSPAEYRRVHYPSKNK
jgi:two-component system, response regulator YesN